jgi:hypothetical protein
LSKFQDLTGQRFGRLVVIERAEDYVRPNGQSQVQWRCKCDCGNEKITVAYSLTHGVCTSCGCVRNENNLARNGLNLIGQKFGLLTVIKYNGSNGTQSTWKCQCDCGNITLASTSSLTQGKKKSCGCLFKCHAQMLGQCAKKYNTYEEHEDCYYGYSLVYPDKFFIIDKDDYEKVFPYCWAIGKDGYWGTTVFNEDGSKFTLKLHQLIMGTSGRKRVPDHEDRDGSNNRKNNLRIASCRQNAINRSLSPLNTSGITGVEWRKSENKWCAKINKEKGKQRIIGRFNTKEEAIKARLEAEKEYYGEFAPQRHLFAQYGVKENE